MRCAVSPVGNTSRSRLEQIASRIGLKPSPAWTPTLIGREPPGCDHSAKTEPAPESMSGDKPNPVPQELAGLRVALVHDWLTGMRGGEKCLEVLCQAFPQAPLYTLIHRRWIDQPGHRIDGDSDVATPASAGNLPPLPAPAAPHALGGPGLEDPRRRPGDQPEPLRRQVGRAAAAACPTSATASRRCAMPGRDATPTSKAGPIGRSAEPWLACCLIV